MGQKTELLSGKPGCPGYGSVQPINHVVKSKPPSLLAVVSRRSLRAGVSFSSGFGEKWRRMSVFLLFPETSGSSGAENVNKILRHDSLRMLIVNQSINQSEAEHCWSINELKIEHLLVCKRHPVVFPQLVQTENDKQINQLWRGLTCLYNIIDLGRSMWKLLSKINHLSTILLFFLSHRF